MPETDLAIEGGARGRKRRIGADPERSASHASGADASASPQPSRKRATSSPVTVNVAVPRGLGRRVDKSLIQRVTQLALERDRWERPATLDIHIVDDEAMRQINASRLGVDEPTDVLSFPMLELGPGEGLRQDFFVLPPDAVMHLGDVVISFPRVEAQAQEAGHSTERELAFLTVHGVLHILGYDHVTLGQRRRMRSREEEVLGELGLRRNGA